MIAISTKLKILIIEDDRLLNKVMELQLNVAGFEVRSAHSGEQALELIAQSLPDLVLLDVSLPELDGFGIIEILRKSPRTAKIPVIVHTSLLLSEEEKLLLILGPTKFISKSTAYSKKITDVLSELITEI